MSLLSDFKKGNKTALKQIYLQYHQNVYALALSFTKDAQRAEDFVHDVFVKFWEQRENLSEQHNIESQLIRTAKFYIINQLKRNKLEVATNVETSEEILEETEAENDQNQLYFLNRAIKKLPQQCREIFIMHKLEGLTQKEVANYLKISVKTVENQVAKAISELKKHLLEHPDNNTVPFK